MKLKPPAPNLKRRRLEWRTGDLWVQQDIEDTAIEVALGARFTRLPPAKPPKTLTAKPKARRHR
jgi:hypothetical protein